MKKKNILLVGVLALGSYLFWRYSKTKKNFSGFPKSTYKEEPVQDILYKFGMPEFGKPEYIIKN
jgi:hypothetical protein